MLSYMSALGTVATIAVCMTVVVSALVEGDVSESIAERRGVEDAEPYHIYWESQGLALAFGMVAYCFSGHAIVPSIYASMEKPQDFEKMVTMTFIVVTILCLMVSFSGYYMFGSMVEDQITLSLESGSKASTAMDLLVWLMIITRKAPTANDFAAASSTVFLPSTNQSNL